MLMPSIFRDDLFDDFFGVPFRGYKFDSGTHQMMRTDIKDLDSSYEVTMDLPGVKKEDVKRGMRLAATSAGSVTAAPAAGASM